MDFNTAIIFRFLRLPPPVLASLLLVAFCVVSADCYDPMDPNGNITVTFDIHKYTDDGYVASVTIQNYYQYRHVEKPGWRIGWIWAEDEVIWTMSGAFATQQGNCSNFKFLTPHSCNKDPSILDLSPEAAPENRSPGCCRGGILSAWTVNPSKSFSSFEIQVGNIGNNTTIYPPTNLTLMAPGPGYTCGPIAYTNPTIFYDIGGMRTFQVYRTWKSSCTYSTFLANKAPVCCTSFSTFYNPIITSCPKCSCGCKETADPTTRSCLSEGDSPHPLDPNTDDVVQCTDHMCPIRVHWHVKSNYVNHWRVKLTVSNYNYRKNYSNWNVLVQHPGFGQSLKAFSFNSTSLPTFAYEDAVALFWGYDRYNNELLHADELQIGSVTTEILLEKEIGSFTLSNGWAFPRRIYFDGESCEMPPPDNFPMLPGDAPKPDSNPLISLLLLSSIVVLFHLF